MIKTVSRRHTRLVAAGGIAGLVLLSLTGCATTGAASTPFNKHDVTMAYFDTDKTSEYQPQLYDQLLSMRKGDGRGYTVGGKNITLRAIAEAARRVGAQAALHWKYEEIMSQVMPYEAVLDRIYNFGPLMVEEVVLPPVISRVVKADRKYSRTKMRTVRVGYRLEHPARIVTTPPTWRGFLVRSFPMPQPPANVLLPDEPKEVKVWEQAFNEGWQQGIRQAQNTFRRSLNLLTSTYLGMMTYHRLEAKNIVSEPQLSSTGLRITYDGDTLNIGDQIYRLVDPAEFQPFQQWDAAPHPADTDIPYVETTAKSGS